MTSPTLVIAHSSARSLRNHLRRTVGSVIGARIVFAGVVSAVAGLTVLAYQFYGQAFVGVFDSNASAQVVQVRGGLIDIQLITSATLGLVLVVFAPVGSGLAVCARIAGARPWQVAVGEFLPTTIGLCVFSAAIGAGPDWFVAEHQAVSSLTFVTLILTRVLFVVVALTVCHGFSALARLLRLPSASTRMLGVVGGFVFVGLLLVDVLRSISGGIQSVVNAAVDGLWMGSDIPVSSNATLVVAVATTTCMLVDLALVALVAPRGALSGARRIVPLPRLGRGLAAFAFREMVLSLRHPIAQLGWLIAILLAGGVVTLVRAFDAPFALPLIAFPLLFSTLAESAYGRSAGWSWIYRTAGVSFRHQSIGQWLGAAAPSVVLSLAMLPAVMSPGGQFFTVTPGLASTALAVGATAYLCGVAIPYSGSASVGMMVTSVLTLGSESVMLYVVSLAGPPGSLAAVVVEAGVVVISLTGAVIVARKRGFSADQS